MKIIVSNKLEKQEMNNSFRSFHELHEEKH
jgi:hypothetical protein